MLASDYFDSSARTRSMRTTSSQSTARALIAALLICCRKGNVSQAKNDARYFHILLLGTAALQLAHAYASGINVTVGYGAFGTAIRAEPDRALEYCYTGNR